MKSTGSGLPLPPGEGWGEGIAEGRSLDESVRRRVRRRRVQALAWAAFLFTLTSWPSPPRVPLVSAIPNFDKLVHFTLYAVQAWLLYRSVEWPGHSRFSLARALAIVGVMAVWGVADETHQTWIPGRSMEGDDVAADVVGAAAGAVAASVVSRRGSGVALRRWGRENSATVFPSPRPSPGGRGSS